MLEMLINPKRAERKSWEMFFIGLLYATFSFLLVQWIFSGNPVLSKYSGVFLVTFTVIFSMPFVYYIIKLEEQKDVEYSGHLRLLKEHSKAIMAFLWLFLGFLVAFSFWYIVLPDGAENFRAQIETFCQINRPGNIEECAAQYGIGDFGVTGSAASITGTSITGELSAKDKVLSIFENNIYVMIFTLIFSIIFGAGAIFILAWNASVIAAAIGIFARSQLSELPMGLLRYMIHGLPEVAAYFIAALSGGILGIAVIKRDTNNDKFWSIVQDSLNLIVIAVIILLISALIEVFITPALF